MGSGEIEERLRSLFFAGTRELPEALRDDLFDRYAGSLERDPGKDGLFEAAARLGEIIDLFERDYDEEGDPLPAPEWDFIRDAVSESAGDLDVETLSYVMRLVVERHRL